MFSQDEQDILNYLKPYGKQFVSAKEVCRRAGGKERFTDDPEWAKPLLKRMEKKGILETDPLGHFRILIPKQNDPKKRQIPLDPRIAGILKSSGHDFSKVFILEDDDNYRKPNSSGKKDSGDQG